MSQHMEGKSVSFFAGMTMSHQPSQCGHSSCLHLVQILAIYFNFLAAAAATPARRLPYQVVSLTRLGAVGWQMPCAASSSQLGQPGLR